MKTKFVHGCQLHSAIYHSSLLLQQPRQKRWAVAVAALLRFYLSPILRVRVNFLYSGTDLEATFLVYGSEHFKGFIIYFVCLKKLAIPPPTFVEQNILRNKA